MNYFLFCKILVKKSDKKLYKTYIYISAGHFSHQPDVDRNLSWIIPDLLHKGQIQKNERNKLFIIFL